MVFNNFRDAARDSAPFIKGWSVIGVGLIIAAVVWLGPAAFVWLALAVPLALKLCIVWRRRRRRKRAQERLRG